MQDREIIQEFLAESAENLERLDLEMVELEKDPHNQELLASVFRTIHTIKGTCGFLGFSRLESLAHVTEDILSELRHGKRELDRTLTTVILEAIDAVKRILASIESSEAEGELFELDLIARLKEAREGNGESVVSKSPVSQGDAVLLQLPEEEAPLPDGAPVLTTVSPAGTASWSGGAGDSSLRVDVGVLDQLMNLVGELVLTRNQLHQFNTSRDDGPLNAISQRLSLITTELQESVMKTRMQPISLVWNKLPRVVRDLATSLGKEIALEMEGAETELDRTIIEAVKDPLTHIVRNACDHGIEMPQRRIERGKPAQGRLGMRAYHEGGQVNIEISDDGAGIDPERVKAKAVERALISAEQAQRLSEREITNLLFLPGFSTAQAVTSISGRGVGMDVVKTHIERIGGTVDLVSQPGQGTTVRVKIPLTLAIIPGLVVNTGGERFIIPQVSVDELIRLEGEAARRSIERIHTSMVFRRRNALLPLADLNHVLNLSPMRAPDEISMVVLQAGEHRFGLIVDGIIDNQDIVVKPLGHQLKALNCYAGATIMGDGRIALILDVMGVGLRAGVVAESGRLRQNDALSTAASQHASTSLLLFRGGGLERLAMPLSRVARLEKIPQSSVEYAAGRTVLQYRGGILPLVSLADLFGGSGADDGETLSVIVCRAGDSDVGLVVDEITDVTDESIHHLSGGGRHGILGSAVVGGRVTDFLDLEAVLQNVALVSLESLDRLRAAVSGQYETVAQEAVR